jgi:hypothetical protein
VSNDLAPQSGPRLDVPAGPDGARAQDPAQPSWARVVGTTLRLWLRRRVLRLADDASVGALRWVGVTAAVVVLAGVTGVVAVGLAKSPASTRPRHPAPKPNPAIALTAANERAAATWLAAQVSSATTVACDPAMCGDLTAAGFPAARESALELGGSLPATAGMVVATPVIQSEASAELAARAPLVLASFGTGAARVQVRAFGAGTGATYLAAVRHQMAASGKTGRGLLRNRRLHLFGAARAEVASGRVDPRLLVVLGRLAAAYPIDVTAFGDSGPGAGWPSQLRSVSIDGLVRGTGRHKVSNVRAVLRLLHGQRAPYRASVRQQQSAGGRVMLIIQFPAPSLSGPGAR